VQLRLKPLAGWKKGTDEQVSFNDMIEWLLVTEVTFKKDASTRAEHTGLHRSDVCLAHGSNVLA